MTDCAVIFAIGSGADEPLSGSTIRLRRIEIGVKGDLEVLSAWKSYVLTGASMTIPLVQGVIYQARVLGAVDGEKIFRVPETTEVLYKDLVRVFPLPEGQNFGPQGLRGEVGPEGPAGPNSIPTDTFVASKVADPTSATGEAVAAEIATLASPRLADEAVAGRTAAYVHNPDATLGWTTSEELIARALGWIVVTDLGAKGNTTFDNTAILQAAVNTRIAAGGGKLYLPFIAGLSNIYRFDQLSVVGTGNVNLTITSAPGVILRANPTLTTDCIIIESNAATTSDPFIRRVTLENLVIQGQTDWTSGTKINRRGIVIGRAQDVVFKNVKLAQFKKGALVLDDVWDSEFSQVEIKWSGHGTSASDYAYALDVTGTIDNTNNCRFTGLHMEFVPMILRIAHNSRHNVWHSSKFEHGMETERNESGLSPIFIDDSIENSFEQCFFVEGKAYSQALIRSPANLSAYLTTYKLRKRTRFVNCEFFATSTAKARWYSGTDTTFTACGFQRTDGASDSFAFDFEARNGLNTCQIAFADAGAQLLRVTGSDNEIDRSRVFTADSGTSGAVLTYGSAALRMRWNDVTVLNGFSTMLATSLTYLANSVCTNPSDPSVTVTGGGTKNVFTKSIVVLNDAGAQTYTNFLYGYAGQTLTIVGNTANQTIQHNANIALLGAVNKTLAIGETITLTLVPSTTTTGVWRQAT